MEKYPLGKDWPEYLEKQVWQQISNNPVSIDPQLMLAMVEEVKELRAKVQHLLVEPHYEGDMCPTCDRYREEI